MNDNKEKNKIVQILVILGMVICICVAAFFSGYYLQSVNSINECNEFINKNYLIPLTSNSNENTPKFNFTFMDELNDDEENKS